MRRCSSGSIFSASWRAIMVIACPAQPVGTGRREGHVVFRVQPVGGNSPARCRASFFHALGIKWLAAKALWTLEDKYIARVPHQLAHVYPNSGNFGPTFLDELLSTPAPASEYWKVM